MLATRCTLGGFFKLGGVIIAAVLLAAFSLLGQQIANPHQLQTPNSPYRIGIGDQLEIKFFYNAELNEAVTVRPDGRVGLQLVNDVEVVGLTVEELVKKLEALYQGQLADAKISVLLRSFATQRVYVDGEVQRAGMVSLVGDVGVRQAIAQAGGLKETAHSNQVLILRRNERRQIDVLTVDLAVQRKGANSEDLRLLPEDIVYVPRSHVANLNRWVDLFIRRNIPITTGFIF